MFERIIEAIDEEIARLEQARMALGNVRTTRRSRLASAKSNSGAKPGRRLSAKARRAIAEAQRRRWAKMRSQQKTSPGSAAEKKEAGTS